MKKYRHAYISLPEELLRMRSQNIVDQLDRKNDPPSALPALFRPDDAAASILEGLRFHYLECLAGGRLAIWASAAHAAVDLLASVPDIKVIKRCELERILEEEAASAVDASA